MMKNMANSTKIAKISCRPLLAVSSVRATRASRTAVKTFAAFETYENTLAYVRALPGITAPFNNVFDPANLCEFQTIKELRRWRESEITHCRVAMLAAVGFIVGEQLQDIPLFYNFDGHITGPAINQYQQLGPEFTGPLLIFIGIAEAYRVAVGWASPVGEDFYTLKDEYNMGDLGFDPLGLKPKDPVALKELQTKELNNGRLAMIAIAAFVAQEVVEESEIFEHLLLRIEGVPAETPL